MAREIDGEPRRAYIELTWVTRPKGTSETDRSTVFFSFVIEDGQWRVTEIRHMR
jgi:hypothetical protein